MPRIVVPGSHKEIIGDDEVRGKKFHAAVEELQYQYDCMIIPIVTIAGTQIIPDWNVGVLPRGSAQKMMQGALKARGKGPEDAKG